LCWTKRKIRFLFSTFRIRHLCIRSIYLVNNKSFVVIDPGILRETSNVTRDRRYCNFIRNITTVNVCDTSHSCAIAKHRTAEIPVIKMTHAFNTRVRRVREPCEIQVEELIFTRVLSLREFILFTDFSDTYLSHLSDMQLFIAIIYYKQLNELRAHVCVCELQFPQQPPVVEYTERGKKKFWKRKWAERKNQYLYLVLHKRFASRTIIYTFYNVSDELLSSFYTYYMSLCAYAQDLSRNKSYNNVLN
jgi:hypothetical protein